MGIWRQEICFEGPFAYPCGRRMGGCKCAVPIDPESSLAISSIGLQTVRKMFASPTFYSPILDNAMNVHCFTVH